MKYVYLIILIISLIIISGFLYNTVQLKEGFNRDTGQFCGSCSDKTFNQCLNCFNCGFCIDKWGNGKCIGGSVLGPNNKENCAFWYTTDDWTTAKMNNNNYRLSYGPKQSNRPIGIDPC